MKRFYLALFAIVALCVVAIGAHFGLSPVDAGGFLSACTDWALGFTGHLDGLSFADAPAVVAVGGALQALKQKRAKAIADARALLDGAGEDATTLSEEDGKRFNDLMAEADQIGARIAQEERVSAAQATLEQRSPVQTVHTDDPAPDVRNVEGVDKHWRRRSVRYLRALALQKEDAHRSAQLVSELLVEARSLPANQLQDEERTAATVIERSGLSERRQRVLRALVGVGEYRTLTTEANDAQGTDHLLPKPFLAEIFVLTEQYGVARQLFRVIPFSGPGNTLDLKQVTGKVLAYWVDQAELIPASDMTFNDGQLSLNKLAGITSMATEVDEDVAFNTVDITINAFAESISLKEDQAGFLGDGSSTYGGFTGVLNLASATVKNTAGTDVSGVVEDILRTVKTAIPRVRRQRAQWVMNETVMDTIRQIENSAGFRLFSESLAEGGAVNLLGYPVVFSDVYPAASAISGTDEPILSFGDHGRMLMAIKRGLRADVSREAILQNSGNDSIIYNAYQADGSLLRVTERVGFAAPAAVQPDIVVLKTKAGS